MTRFRLVASDLDGTLLNEHGELTQHTIEVIRRVVDQGIRFVLATTRNLYSVRTFADQIGINEPVICSNGAHVLSSPYGTEWAYHTISESTARAIAAFADENNWSLYTTIGDMTYWRQAQHEDPSFGKPELTLVERNSEAITDRPLRIFINDPQGMGALGSYCETNLGEDCYVERYFKDGELWSLGIFAMQANKQNALEIIQEKLGTSREETMVCGDNPNDIPLFQAGGWRVAMGNAVGELKRLADVIAPTNSEDGVAWALEKYILSDE